MSTDRSHRLHFSVRCNRYFQLNRAAHIHLPGEFRIRRRNTNGCFSLTLFLRLQSWHCEQCGQYCQAEEGDWQYFSHNADENSPGMTSRPDYLGNEHCQKVLQKTGLPHSVRSAAGLAASRAHRKLAWDRQPWGPARRSATEPCAASTGKHCSNLRLRWHSEPSHCDIE